jgi:iron complex outermembrane receptor protein
VYRLVAIVLFASAALAQNTGTIRGTVSLKADNSRLHNASVVITQLRRSVETGPEGTFEFRNVPPGTYDLIAHVHALTDERKRVTVPADGVAEVAFELAIAGIRQEVTVTASGREETTLETFQSVTAIEGVELTTRSSAPSLGDLLDQEPGIAKRSFGPGTSRPVVRGFDGDRVLVLQDGVRTGTLSSQSGDHGEPVDPTAVERVEVVRGPGTLLYGSNAIGGVVNILTRHHELHEHPHEGVRGSLTGVAGSTNGQAGGSANVEAGVRNWLLWAGGGGTRTGDYDTPIGEVPNSGTWMRHANGGFGRYGDRGTFTVNYGFQQGRYGVPFVGEFAHHHEEGAEEEEEEEEHGEVDIDWHRHNVRLQGGLRSLRGALEQITGVLSYTDWNHTELEGTEVGTRFFNRQLTWQGMFQQRPAGLLSGSFGYWGMHRDFKAIGAEALAPPVKQNAIAVFALEQLNFEKFRLQFGGRLENNRYRPDGLRDRDFTGVSGSVGINVPLTPDTAFVASLTSSYRAPALEELYNNGPHLGNLTFEVGNPDLERERSSGVEVSLRHVSSRVRAEVNTFFYRFSDFVFLAPTGSVEDGLIEADYTQANARYMGAESVLDAVVHPNATLRLGFDVVDAQLRDSHIPLPRIPPVRGRVGVDLHKGGFSVRPELVLANRQWQVFPTETPTAGYALFNVGASYTRAGQHVMHVIGAELFNVGDRLWRNHLSFIKELAPEIGRGVRVSYTVNFY